MLKMKTVSILGKVPALKAFEIAESTVIESRDHVVH